MSDQRRCRRTIRVECGIAILLWSLAAGFMTANIPNTVCAQDSWLAADRSIVDVGESIKVSFATGGIFSINESATSPRRVSSFIIRDQSRARTLEDFHQSPGGLEAMITLESPGLRVIGCALKPHAITRSRESFLSSLAEEREADIVKQLETEEPSSVGTREQYTKFAKMLVSAGEPDPSCTVYSQELGHRLEIIPLSNPLLLHRGERLRVRVLLEGHPWAGVAVSAAPSGPREHPFTFMGRTGSDGEETIPINVEGPWIIKARLMRPASPLEDHDWECFRASLTFMTSNAPESSWAARAFNTNVSHDLTPSDEALAADIRRVVATHGSLSPWAALGFRMGRRALGELDIPAGDPRLLAVHRTPFELPYTAIADGIQASTGASIGKLTLLIARVELADLHSEFMDQHDGGGVTIRPTRELLSALTEARSEDEALKLATRILSHDDAELFLISRDSALPPPSEPFPASRTAISSPAKIKEHRPVGPSPADPAAPVEERIKGEMVDYTGSHVGLSTMLSRACAAQRS